MRIHYYIVDKEKFKELKLYRCWLFLIIYFGEWLFALFSMVVSHFSFLISHFSYKAKTFDKGGKMCIINIAEVLFVVKTLIKKYIYIFFFGSVLDKIRLSSRSPTIKM